jgi:gliding motility-associated-like protein
VNDYLEVYGSKKTMTYLHMAIFDRWGEKVFESNDMELKWDGRFKGELMEPGVYVYAVDIAFTNGHTVHNKGSITLIR